MSTVILTDAKYRSAVAAARSLARAGHHVVAVQTRADVSGTPAVFASAAARETRWIGGSVGDAEYPDRLAALLAEYDAPVVFPVGAATLNLLARERERFAPLCRALIAPPDVLDALNDKETVHRRAAALGLPVPREFTGVPDVWPVVLKPHCGEKFGLKAADRYIIAENETEYRAALERLAPYDPAPIVQEKLTGEGAGASLLLDADSRLIGAFCHRRIREYPVSGGPSTCCESVYDEEKIAQAYALLKSFGFVGLAMVEFKGASILEVNPRVWGSFPLTDCAGSPLAAHYAAAAAGETVDYAPCDYETGVRMRFLLNDAAAVLSLLKHGRVREALGGVRDFFAAKEALHRADDPGVLRAYLKFTWEERAQ